MHQGRGARISAATFWACILRSQVQLGDIDGDPTRLVEVSDNWTALMHYSTVMQASFSVQVSSKLCSASFGTISHLVPAIRQSVYDAPRLSIVHVLGEHSHFLRVASPLSRITDVSWQH